MRYPDTIPGRILAVLDYDGIPERRRAAHLRDTCDISESTARRALRGHRGWNLLKLARGLEVDCFWLYDGSLTTIHPRTWRIRIQNVLGYPPEETGDIMRLFTGYFAKHGRAVNLISLVHTEQLSMEMASRIYAVRQ